jgi:NADP-dependent 3-hydroxy acid dehydrogenase YdfG
MTVWFITGAARGFGIEITRQALSRGDQVVATARHPEAITQALPHTGDALLALPLDVTSAGQAAAAVSAALARFGRIDSLVNNAGRGLLGAVEEVSDVEARAVFEVNVFGLLTVTRAVLPVMRGQGAGKIITARATIEDYAGTAGATRQWAKQTNHAQAGDPVKAAKVIVDLAGQESLPERIQLGEDCFTAVASKLARTARDQARWREISISTGYRA